MTQAVALAQQASTGVSPGFRNRIINGAMVIDQRNAGASVTPTVDGTFGLDRWKFRFSQASKFSFQQDAGVVTPPVGFTDYLGVTSLSSFTPASGDYFNLQQPIEGFNFADCGWGTANAKTVTLSFWVRSSLTGTFAGRLINSAGNRVNVFTYSISAANTWEQKSITIAGDTSGSWVGGTNGIGVTLAYDLGSGSAYETATTGSWITTDSIRTASSIRIISTNGATFYITGVQLEVGSTATSFDYRPYTTELQLAQRYFWQMVNGDQNNIANGVYYSGDTFICSIQYPVTMRTAPTLSYVTGTSYYIIYVNGSDPINAMYLGATTSTGTNLESGGQGASGTIGYGGQLRSNNASAKLAFTAEL